MAPSASAAAAAAVVSLQCLLLLLADAFADDLLCLEGFKRLASASYDPYDLRSWDLTNTSVSYYYCHFQGVTCSNMSENRIINIDFSGFGLSGGLPESLKNCQSLQRLDLSNNDLSVPIPTQICDWLPNLVALDLSYNSLSGWPESLKNCQSLQRLHLSNNKLSGPIPTQICDWLPNLVLLDLSRNSLSGSIPSQIFDCWNLVKLVLRENKLSGHIPYKVGSRARLSEFSVVNNSLSGPMPSELFANIYLTWLDLSYNHLSGPIPTQICDLLPNLTTLDLSHNSLSGSIPSHILDCWRLNLLILSDNKLSGHIPYELGGLRMTQFSVSNNNLSGTIPSELSAFSPSDFNGNSDLCGYPLRSCGGRIDKEKIIIAITVPVGGALVLLCLTCFHRRKGKKAKNAIKGIKGSKELTTAESLQFDFATLQAATNDFSLENKLGEGGFGEVFQGRLPDEQQIAVKRLSQSSRQGNEEFINEVLVVAKLQHRNLVRLLGFCLEGDEKLLAYEFVTNKSLDYFLFDPQKSGQLDWPSRYKIVLGIARGMLYLHQDSRLRIIHRDLKCSNILLDSEMNPKISDFGMARIFAINQTQASTNKIVGTFGYMSPEYAMHGEFSMKSDVYSFGILLLEIISGKRNNFYHQLGGGEYLASYAWNQWRENKPLEVLDPAIVDSYSRDEVLQCLHICLLCIQEDPAIRPTMATVVLMLSGNSITQPSPRRPAFFVQSRSRRLDVPTEELESDESTRRTMPMSANHMSVTELYPR